MRVTVIADIGKLRLTSREIEQLEVRQELGSHHFCTLSFYRETGTTLDVGQLLGATIHISLEDEAERVVAFSGEVTEGTQQYLPHGGMLFVVEGASPSFRFQQYQRTRYYPEHTLADLAQRLGAEMVGAGSTPAVDYVQYGESDFDFLVRAADDAGCLVRPTNPGASKPVEVRRGFSDRVWELTWGSELTSLSAHCRAVNHGYKGTAAETLSKAAYRYFGERQDPPMLGGACALVASVKKAAAGGGEPNVEVLGTRAPTKAAYRALLQRESARALGGAVFLDGTSSAIGLTAGDRITVNGGENWQQAVTGDLGLVRVIHSFNGDQYFNQFTASPWAGYTNARRPAPLLMSGCLTATVVDNRDASGLGAVQVKYRWQDTGERTTWVRMVSPYAGNERGLHFLPEVGDEVLITFDHGDPERPFVLGALWSRAAESPARSPDIKSIVSRSGHMIRLDDTKGAESIEIHSATGTCLVRLDTATKTLTIHSEGDIALEAPNGQIRLVSKDLLETISGDAWRDVKGSAVVKTGKSLTLAAGTDLSAGAGTNAVLTAGVSLESSAGAMNTVLGAMVHINPPGRGASAVQASAPAPKGSIWKTASVPQTKAFDDDGNAPKSSVP